jgi:hypothetical protein
MSSAVDRNSFVADQVLMPIQIRTRIMPLVLLMLENQNFLKLLFTNLIHSGSTTLDIPTIMSERCTVQGRLSMVHDATYRKGKSLNHK